MLHACPKCGAANDEHAQACYVCDAPYDHMDEENVPSQRVTRAETDSLSLNASESAPVSETLSLPQEPERDPAAEPQPEWRREVAHRLEAYRARRRRNGRRESDDQAHLPFNGANGNGERSEPDYRASLRTVSHSSSAAAPEKREKKLLDSSDRIEIPVIQPEFSFVLAPEEEIHPHAPLVPVAELRERGRAGLLDTMFLGLSYGGFLALFHALGGQLSFGKSEALVYLATLSLLYMIYFGLFTSLGGTTPGMYFRGLAVVGFDGEPPAMSQLLWRSFGYLVSAGTLMIGFLWALWDEDSLTWQDRISQTYLTSGSVVWHNAKPADNLSLPRPKNDSGVPHAT